MVDSMKQVSQVEMDKVDKTLAKVPHPESFWLTLGPTTEWGQVGQMDVPCDDYPTGIAVAPNGTIAICDNWNRILVLSKSGDLIHTIDDGVRLGGAGDISITPTNGYVILNRNNFCQVYDSNYKLLSKFKTYNANKESSEAKAVTVDKNGCVILGIDDVDSDISDEDDDDSNDSSMNGNAISVHGTDGSFISSFAIPYRPSSIAVTSHEQIAIASYDNQSLQLFSYSGECLMTIDPPPEVNDWCPRYVCCTMREMFVFNDGDPRAIYRYTTSGVYLGCIVKGLDFQWGIALSHDEQELYVVECSENEVKIFKRP